MKNRNLHIKTKRTSLCLTYGLALNSSGQKQKAEQIAEKVDGVKDVENKITVKP